MESAPRLKRRKRLDEDAVRAQQLESLLFGSAAAGAEEEEEEEEGPSAEAGGGAGLGGALLFVEDRAGAAAAEAPAPRRQPVWEDGDDERVRVDVAGTSRLRKLREAEEEQVLSGRQYEQRLRQQHSKLNPRTGWAAPRERGRRRGAGAGGEAEEDDESAGEAGGEAACLLARAGGLLDGRPVLAPGLLETTRLRDANQEEPCQSVVRSVEFHANGQLLLTAGLDKRLRFFNVDGVHNRKVQSVFLEDMPVHKAAFTGSGEQVVAAGRRKFFCVFDLAAARAERVAGLLGREERSWESFAASQGCGTLAFFGADGHVPLVSLRSRQLAGTLKMSGTVRAGAFSADGAELLTSGGDGAVYVWDLRTRRCRARLLDEGSLRGTALAASPDGRLWASGSSSGVVNVYDGGSTGGAGGGAALPAPAAAARPLKSVMNLTTAIDTLTFNHDGQLLVLGSRLKRDALRLLHVPSMTVFSNWPTSKSPLHYVHAAAFSPTSGYLAIGNARGRALLYRLHAYPAA